MKKILGIIGAFIGGVIFAVTGFTSLFTWAFITCFIHSDQTKYSKWFDSIGR